MTTSERCGLSMPNAVSPNVDSSRRPIFGTIDFFQGVPPKTGSRLPIGVMAVV